jgi:hypothetical protein
MNETAYRDGERVIHFFLYCEEIKTYGRALAALQDPVAWPCVLIGETASGIAEKIPVRVGEELARNCNV